MQEAVQGDVPWVMRWFGRLDKSDVDIAVYGCTRFSQFSLDVDEEVWTLLTFDIVNMDAKVSDELKKEIEELKKNK